MIKKKSPQRKIAKKTVRKLNDTERLRNWVVDGMIEKKSERDCLYRLKKYQERSRRFLCDLSRRFQDPHRLHFQISGRIRIQKKRRRGISQRGD